MDRNRELRESWDRNAGNWIRAVREGLIPSRKAGTDQAVFDAILRRKPKRLLDVGCGEGWLLRRAVEACGCQGVGIDACADLVAAARGADSKSRYEVVTYDDLTAGRDTIGAGFDVIVCNYALFEDDIAALLAALRGRLSANGTIVIQTLHPDTLAQSDKGRDKWRVEDFAAFENQAWVPMPWYDRGRESWQTTLRGAGLRVRDLIEPRAGPGEPPLSLLFVCAAG